MLAHLDHAPRYRNAITLALATGMRRGEVIGLRWESVDLNRRILTVREARYELIGKHGNKAPKGGRTRDVDLSDMAARALRFERTRQVKAQRAAGDAWQDEGFVFTDDFGRPVAPMGLSAAFRHVTEQAGLGGRYTLHALRHTAATWMLAGGTDIKTAQRLLGHSEAGILLRTYAHAIEGRGREAVGTIESTLGRGRRKSR
jgi:integrase